MRSLEASGMEAEEGVGGEVRWPRSGKGSWGGAMDSRPLLLSSKMEKEVSDFIQDSGQVKKKFQPMNKIERSIL